MTPEASLQKRGKDETGLRQGPRPSCEVGGQSPRHTFPPAPGPRRSPGGPSGPKAPRGTATRALHLREKAVRAPCPPPVSDPVLHPSFPLPGFVAAAGSPSWSPARPRPLAPQPRTPTDATLSPPTSCQPDQSEPSTLRRSALFSFTVC